MPLLQGRRGRGGKKGAKGEKGEQVCILNAHYVPVIRQNQISMSVNSCLKPFPSQ